MMLREPRITHSQTQNIVGIVSLQALDRRVRSFHLHKFYHFPGSNQTLDTIFESLVIAIDIRTNHCIHALEVNSDRSSSEGDEKDMAYCFWVVDSDVAIYGK